MKALFVILLSVLTPSIMFAQGMRVHTTDGKVVDYPKSQLSFVDFYEAGESDKVNVPHLTSVTIDGAEKYRFIWTGEGITKYYSEWDGPLAETNIQHNSWTANWADEAKHRKSTSTYSNIKRNSMGYVTSFNYSNLYERTESGVTTTSSETGTYNFSYNSDGTLAAITSVVKELYDDGDYDTESFYVELTWNNGNLMSIEIKSSDTWKNDLINFKYSDELNPHRQILYSQAYNLFDSGDDGLEFIRGLCMTGHFGLGSINLPTESEDGDYVYKILVNIDKGRVISENKINTTRNRVNIISYEYE